MMQRQIVLAAAVAITNAARARGQSPTAASNPLDNFIGVVNSAVAAASSAVAVESQAASSTPASTSAIPTSSATPIASPSATAAPDPSGGLSNGARIGIIVAAVVVALLLLALIAGCIYYCCTRRRRRNKRAAPIPDEEIGGWRRPSNPGRTYTPVTTHSQVPMAQHPTVSPTVPLMTHTEHPAIAEHPMYRHENPFVPVPPLPRKAVPHSRTGVADGTVPGTAAFVASSPRKSTSMTRPWSGSGSHDSYASYRSSINTTDPLPTHHDVDRPATPFGLYGNKVQRKHGHLEATTDGSKQPYSAIGAPYNDMHVHTLQTDQPSHELRQSLSQRPSPLHIQPHSHSRRSGNTTPPMVSSRSPQRRSGFQDSTYDTGSSTNSSSGESWRSTHMHPPGAPWDDREKRYSGDKAYDGRVSSRSAGRTSWQQGAPMPPPNGNSKRLRFGDMQGRDSTGVGQAM